MHLSVLLAKKLKFMINVICLKWGNKYSADYVNRLLNMVKYNISSPFNFYCLTDDKKNLADGVIAVDLPDIPLEGWWFKLYLFKDGLLSLKDGSKILFLDLDIIITGNIDPLFTYDQETLCISSDINESRYNSSVMFFKTGKFGFIWDSFYIQKDWIMEKMHGDQDWIEYIYKGATIYPKSMIKSFKIDLNSKTPYSFGKLGKNLRKRFPKLAPKGETPYPEKTAIVLFHGKPDPKDVMEIAYDKYRKAPWIKDIYSKIE